MLMPVHDGRPVTYSIPVYYSASYSALHAYADVSRDRELDRSRALHAIDRARDRDRPRALIIINSRTHVMIMHDGVMTHVYVINTIIKKKNSI